MVSRFETGRTYQFTGGSGFRHKFWNKSKSAWKKGNARLCTYVTLDGRASFEGIAEPTGKYAGKTGWNYNFCLQHFADVTREAPVAAAPPATAPSIKFPQKSGVASFLAGMIDS